MWCMSPQVLFSFLQGCEPLEGLQELGCEGGKAVPIPGSSGDHHMQTWS